MGQEDSMAHTIRTTLALTLLAGVVLVTASVASSAQPSPATPATSLPAFLSRLDGQWQGSGTILGQPARIEMRWAVALDDAFHHLTWVSRIGAGATPRRFEGQAFYGRTPAGAGRAVWVDSSGLTRPITATLSADGAALVAAWGTADTELGETTYRLESPESLLVVDRVRGKDGTWREFGRSTLSRTLPPE
jgi:hypothetical protein